MRFINQKALILVKIAIVLTNILHLVGKSEQIQLARNRVRCSVGEACECGKRVAKECFEPVAAYCTDTSLRNDHTICLHIMSKLEIYKLYDLTRRKSQLYIQRY